MSNTKKIVTRFPPSPTGFMHIGTARTALFNWLYARGNNGEMLFRIEDTDRARHNEEAVEALIEAMKWLGMDWDGEIVSQHANQQRHKEVAEQLLAEGKAWKCYFSQEELEQIRKDNGGFKLPRKDELEANYTPASQDAFTIRITAPAEGVSTIQDHVQGRVDVQNSELDDFVLLRSDGTPTYMLSVVVDDHDMGVTHVIRGDDHLNNTFRQNVIYDALGWEKPVYAHIPLILGPDGKKMSKRHGAASVEEYQKMGYLPEAMRNYILKLGWAHGDDEIISDQQALEWFTLEGIGKAAARFDFDKLESLNAHYINECDDERLVDLVTPFFQSLHSLEVTEQGKERLLAGMEELKSRAKTLIDFANDAAFYLKAVPFVYDEKASTMIADAKNDILPALRESLSALDDFSGPAIQQLCKDVAASHADGKMGKVGMPLRAAITGTTSSPSIFDACAILGKDETLARLDAAMR